MISEKPTAPSSRSIPAQYGLAFVVCAVTAAATLPLHAVLDLANIVMLFLLAVFAVATFFGRGPAVMASFLSVALFDFFFVPPQLSFSVADAQYLVTFAVMLAVGLATAQLVSRLAEQTAEAQARERETGRLYEAARGMAGAQTFEDIVAAAGWFLADRHLGVNLLVASDTGEIRDIEGGRHTLGALEMSFVHSAYQRNEIVETDSLAGMGVAIVFVPLRAPTRVSGVLAVTPLAQEIENLRNERPVIEALASLVALAVERLHSVQASRRAELQVTEERLRTSVLSSLSHDLRNPLTTLVGLADSLAQRREELPADAAEAASVLRDQAQAMHRLLSDLLDMTRLQGTTTVLRREWQPLEDVLGSSLRLVENTFGRHEVVLDLPNDLPLVYFDAVLIERVLCNLLENACKYSSPASPITLSARWLNAALHVSVSNEGPGFPGESLESLFDLFVRGQNESSVPGVGLGLAICKAIVVAHGGTIFAENRPGGARISFTLPCDSPPAVEEEEGK